ncbi:hypothetical protein Tco_0763144 [Tanacetum coccineum]
MMPPLGFSTPPQIPNINISERPPVTTTVFAATTPKNTPFAYRASTLANPNPIISPAFVEANYEVLESLLRERQRHIRNEDLRIELEYFSEDYDEEREMEPRIGPTMETTPPLRPSYPFVGIIRLRDDLGVNTVKMRMEQYLQCIDYTLWEIIENGNAPIVTKLVDGKETAIPSTSVEEKAQRRTELQKLISQLEMHGEVISQENINQKFLRSLSQEWTMHTIVWRNKPEIERDGLEVEHCYANYESKKIPKEYWREAGHDQQRKNWSDQAKEGPTNFALMAYSSTSSSSSTNSEVSNDLNCLESVEARLLVFKKNESVYEEDIKLLKREIYLRDLDITELKRKLELVTKEKDEIMDKCKIGLGYNAVPPPYTGNFMPPKSDLVYPSLDDFVDVNESVSGSVVEKPTNESNEPKTARKEDGALIIEDWVSESEEENVPKIKTVEMFNKPSFAKINFVKSTKQVKSPRNTSVDKNRQNTPSPRGNKRNWNQMMSELFNKACHVCGSFEHLRKDCNN